MFGFLNNPYPFNNDLKYNSKIIIFISLGVLAFIVIIQPVDISAFSKKELAYLFIGLTASTFIILSMNLIFLPTYFPALFDNTRWNVKREILWNTWTLMTITANYYIFYSKIFGIILINVFDILRIIFLGLLPVAAIIVINHNRLLRLNLSTARQMNIKLSDGVLLKEKLVNFESEYKKDNLIIKSDAVILIRAADNYAEVFYMSDQVIKKQMIRNSLIKINRILSEYGFFFQCHRSYIVNIHHIKRIQGSSLGYKLFFDGIEFPALVSQNYIESFNKLI